MIKKLEREEFFGHELILKLTNNINKRTLNGFNYIYIKDKKLIKLLKVNSDWLDFVGLTINKTKIKDTYCLRWRGL